jgi:hypothetical protein
MRVENLELDEELEAARGRLAEARSALFSSSHGAGGGAGADRAVRVGDGSGGGTRKRGFRRRRTVDLGASGDGSLLSEASSLGSDMEVLLNVHPTRGPGCRRLSHQIIMKSYLRCKM